MKVTFTEDELCRARHIIRMRFEPKRETGVRNRKVDSKKSDMLVDYRGCLAEIAVSKSLNTGMDESFSLAGDDGYDFVFSGKKIEVKYTFHPHGHLITWNKDKLNADIIILVTGDEHGMDILGWIEQEVFLMKGQYREFGMGPTFSLEQKDLKPFSELNLISRKTNEPNVTDFM